MHHTFNRFINVHGTDEAIMRNNVGYDAVGHGYFLEDGIERNGLLIFIILFLLYFITNMILDMIPYLNLN